MCPALNLVGETDKKTFQIFFFYVVSVLQLEGGEGQREKGIVFLKPLQSLIFKLAFQYQKVLKY